MYNLPFFQKRISHLFIFNESLPIWYWIKFAKIHFAYNYDFKRIFYIIISYKWYYNFNSAFMYLVDRKLLTKMWCKKTTILIFTNSVDVFKKIIEYPFLLLLRIYQLCALSESRLIWYLCSHIRCAAYHNVKNMNLRCCITNTRFSKNNVLFYRST